MRAGQGDGAGTTVMKTKMWVSRPETLKGERMVTVGRQRIMTRHRRIANECMQEGALCSHVTLSPCKINIPRSKVIN